MQNFNQYVQQFFQKHRKQKRHAVMAVLLSLIVAFTVCGSLITPAVSMTGSTDNTEAITLLEDSVTIVGEGSDADYFTEAQETAPDGAHKLLDTEIDKVSVKIGDTTYDGTSNITVSDDEANVSFTLSYTISNGTGSAVSTSQRYICFQLPDGFSVTGEQYGSTAFVADANAGMTNNISGYYSISKDGLVVIKFLEEYLNTVGSTINGEITFSGTVSRDNTADGNKSIIICGKTFTFDFPDKPITLAKTGTVSAGANGNPVITWTVTASNPYPSESQTLDGYTLSDTMLSSATSVTIDPANAATKNEDNSYSISDSANSIDEVTFTYTQEVTDYDGTSQSVENKANLSKDGANTLTADASVYLNAVSIIKTGIADYDDVGTVDKKINWKITVTNPYGGSLDGYVVSDSMLSSADADSITVTNSSGLNVTYERSGNALTLGTDASGTVTIAYSTSADDSKTYSNGANLSYNDSSRGTAQANVTYNIPYQMNKSGTYDNDTGQITWKVDAYVCTYENEGGWGNSNLKAVLDNYVITDTAFESVPLSDMTITAGTNKKAVTNSDGAVSIVNAYDESIVYATLSKSGNTITVNAVKDASGNLQQGVQEIHLSYAVDATDTEKANSTATNTASDNYRNTKEAKVSITSRNQITKTLTNASSLTSTTYNGASDTSQTLNWEIDLVRDGGFSSTDNSLILVDALTGTNGGTHTMSEEQISGIVVKAKKNSDDSYNTLTSDDYTVTSTKDDSGTITGFQIQFNSSIDTVGYKYVQVTYSTTADYSGVSNANGNDEVTASFSNNASFDGKGASTDWTLTKKDPNYTPKVDLTVKKVWSDDNNASGDRPDSITFQLQRKAGSNGAWANYDPSGEGSGTVTLSNENEWSFTFTNLDGASDAHVTYYYQAVETDVLDYYTVSYSSAVTSGEFTITNTHEETVYTKTALDKNQNAITELSTSELATKLDTTKIDGVTYYIVGWRIDLESDDAITITDTLPEDWIFWNEYLYGGNTYPLVSMGKYSWSLPSSTSASYYAADRDTVQRFIVTNGYQRYIIYYTCVPVSTLTGGYTAINSTTSTLTQKVVTGELAITQDTGGTGQIDNSLLTKSVSTTDNNSYGGLVNYSVLVNPNGNNLSNTDSYTIDDVFTVESFDGIATADVLENTNVELSQIKVTNANTGEEITDVSYTVEQKPTETPAQEEPLVLTPGTISSGSSVSLTDSSHDGSEKVSSVVIDLGEDSSTRLGRTGLGLKVKNKSGGEVGYIWVSQYNDYASSYNYTASRVGDTVTFSTDSPEQLSSLEFGNQSFNIKSITVTYAAPEPVITSSAALHLTVPDETPLKIEYTYKVSSNETSDNSKTFTVSNSASFSTDNVQAADSVDQISFTIVESSASSSSSAGTRVVKTDRLSQGTKLDAKFWLAKYEGNTWYFLTDDTYNENSKRHDLTFGAAATGDTIPDTATTIEITSDSDYYTDFTSGTLYMIIECKAPDGYQGSDATIATITPNSGETKYDTLSALLKAYLENPSGFTNSAYAGILKDFVAVHYFTYGDYTGTLPDGITVTGVKANGTLNIANSKPVTITAAKTWSDSSTNGTAQLALYWSTKKSSTIPEDATLATADNLGVSTLTNPVTVTDTSAWEDLPGSIADKQVYYYLKETAYTLHTGADAHTGESCTGCTTYTLQTDGTYQDSSGNTGDYLPNYTGNGMSKTGTITVNNAKGLTVEKVWKDSNNQTLTDGLPSSIDVKIYGVDASGGKTLIQNGSSDTWTITAGKDWELQVPSTALAGYTNVEVTEVTALDGYNTSITKSLNGTSGTVTITNKSTSTETTTPTEKTISLTVQKTWGSTAPTNATVQLELHRAITPYDGDGMTLITTTTASTSSTTTTTTTTTTTSSTSSTTTTTTTTTASSSSEEVSSSEPANGGSSSTGSGVTPSNYDVDNPLISDSVISKLELSYPVANQLYRSDYVYIVDENDATVCLMQICIWDTNTGVITQNVTTAVSMNITISSSSKVTIEFPNGLKVKKLYFVPNNYYGFTTMDYEITYVTPTSYNAPRKVAAKSVADTADVETVQTITLTSTNDWKATIDDLPACDEDGNPYYYWVTETAINDNPSQLAYYTVAYRFEDGDDNTTYCINSEKLGAATITVRNTKTQSDAAMPSTGGVGTRWYTITGAACTGTALAAGLIRIRRRRKRQRVK